MPEIVADILEDEQDAAQRKRKDQVEFLVLAPAKVPPKRTFRIFVNVQGIPPATDNVEEPDKYSFETLVAEVQRGSRVGLVLESRPSEAVTTKTDYRLLVDAPYQALTWGGRELILDFVVHSPASPEKLTLRSRLWITVGRIAVYQVLKGKIDIEVDVDPALTDVLDFAKHETDTGAITIKEFQTHSKVAEYSGVGKSAVLFESAFISYAHADHKRVAEFLKLMTAAYADTYVDVLDMKKGPHWLVQVAKQIQESDILYLFWSKAAARSPSIQEELDVIEAEIKRRNREKLSPLSICTVMLEDVKEPLPDWLRSESGYSKRPQAFDEFYN